MTEGFLSVMRPKIVISNKNGNKVVMYLFKFVTYETKTVERKFQYKRFKYVH